MIFQILVFLVGFLVKYKVSPNINLVLKAQMLRLEQVKKCAFSDSLLHRFPKGDKMAYSYSTHKNPNKNQSKKTLSTQNSRYS